MMNATQLVNLHVLHEQNNVIAEHDCYWWGRTMSGQAIYMDRVIAEICNGFD